MQALTCNCYQGNDPGSVATNMNGIDLYLKTESRHATHNEEVALDLYELSIAYAFPSKYKGGILYWGSPRKSSPHLK